MRLHVMRHGPAEDRAASGRDFDRALTREGQRVVEIAAGALFAKWPTGAALRVVTSPFRRALETARLVAKLAPPGAVSDVEEDDALGADADRLPLELVLRVASAGRDALLVGHQPLVEALVKDIARDPVRLPGGFRTATVVTLDYDDLGFSFRTTLDPHA